MITENTIRKLVCLKCKGALEAGEKKLVCKKCGASYPLVSGRFPDFLTDAQKAELSAELAFWENHFGGTEYDSGETDASYQAWIDLMAVKPDDEIVEIGCGSGALIKRLKAKSLVGLEPVAGLLEATSGFDGVIGWVQSLPFADNSFDIVFFKFALHHVTDIEAGIREAVRITKPGGRILIMEPNGQHPQRKLISDPASPFRKMKSLIRLIGPVETFFSADKLIGVFGKHPVKMEALVYRDSEYPNPSIRKRLQKLYGILFGWIVPHKYVYPDFFISFRKAG